MLASDFSHLHAVHRRTKAHNLTHQQIQRMSLSMGEWPAAMIFLWDVGLFSSNPYCAGKMFFNGTGAQIGKSANQMAFRSKVIPKYSFVALLVLRGKPQ